MQQSSTLHASANRNKYVLVSNKMENCNPLFEQFGIIREIVTQKSNFILKSKRIKTKINPLISPCYWTFKIGTTNRQLCFNSVFFFCILVLFTKFISILYAKITPPFVIVCAIQILGISNRYATKGQHRYKL